MFHRLMATTNQELTSTHLRAYIVGYLSGNPGVQYNPALVINRAKNYFPETTDEFIMEVYSKVMAEHNEEVERIVELITQNPDNFTLTLTGCTSSGPDVPVDICKLVRTANEYGTAVLLDMLKVLIPDVRIGSSIQLTSYRMLRDRPSEIIHTLTVANGGITITHHEQAMTLAYGSDTLETPVNSLNHKSFTTEDYRKLAEWQRQ